jgi:hypothetical protein
VGSLSLKDKKRVVAAPQSGALDASSPVIYVVLGDEEEVRWQWTHLPDGRSFVTGYEIVKQSDTPPRD